MRAAPVLFGLLFAPAGAFAAGLFPGPSDPGHDAALYTKARAYDRQFHLFNAAPFGISLDAIIPDPNDRGLVNMFFAQSATDDFAAFTGNLGTPRTIEGIIALRDEHGDLGMFGGFGAMGEAFRYAVLRDSGAPQAEVNAARADLLEAIESFHVYTAITGAPGTIARGIKRTTERMPPATVPFPASCQNAWERTDTWRDDPSGQHAGWYMFDNTSKDQLLGYALALGAFWDAIAEDPSIAANIKTRLREDARLLAVSLMTPVEVRAGTAIDLVIKDTNNCPTRFHDINPREVLLGSSAPIVLAETASNQNSFNALAALGIIRTMYHVSGDAAVRQYYYDVLVGTRNYHTLVSTGAGRVRNMFANTCAVSCVVTNFSNVNMAFTAIFGLLRYESDPALRATYEAMLESELWTGPRPHMGAEIQQAFFNLIYSGFRTGGTDPTTAAAASAQLREFMTPPYFELPVTNCDAAEIAAGSCIAEDGVTTITIDSVPGRGGGVAAVSPIPKHTRPNSNFEWRSDPRSVNGGGGGDRLNPGGDFRGTYWLGRALSAGNTSGTNVSPIARNRDGSGGPVIATDAGVADSGNGGADAASDAGVAADAQPADAGAADASSPADSGTPPADAGSTVDAGTISNDAGASANDAASSAQDATIDPDGTPDPMAAEGCGCQATEPPRKSAAGYIVLLVLFGLVGRVILTRLAADPPARARPVRMQRR